MPSRLFYRHWDYVLSSWPVKKAWRWYQIKLPTRKNCAVACKICFICFSTLKKTLTLLRYVTTRSCSDFRDVQGITFCPGEPFISESSRFDHIFSKLFSSAFQILSVLRSVFFLRIYMSFLLTFQKGSIYYVQKVSSEKNKGYS